MTSQDEAVRRLLLRVPKRRRIYEAVVAFPGTHARRLSRELGIALGVVEHHVRLLHKHGVLYGHQHGRRRTLYAAGHVAPEDAPLIHLLRKPVWGRLLHALSDGERSVASLAQALGLPAATVSYNLRRLHEAGVLEHMRVGRESAYLLRDGPRLQALVQRLRPELPGAAPDAAFEGVVDRAHRLRPTAATRLPREPTPLVVLRQQD